MSSINISPLALTAEQRKANSAALQDRIANAMSRVASDRTQTARVRDANARDAKTARQMAKTIREA